MTFREVRSAHQPEVNRFGQTSSSSPRHSVRSASSHTTPAHAAPRVPFLHRRITIPTSDQTPIPGPAPHPHPQGTPTDNPRLLLSGLSSGSTSILEPSAYSRVTGSLPARRRFSISVFIVMRLGSWESVMGMDDRRQQGLVIRNRAPSSLPILIPPTLPARTPGRTESSWAV